jgi:hypothetical protein
MQQPTSNVVITFGCSERDAMGRRSSDAEGCDGGDQQGPEQIKRKVGTRLGEQPPDAIDSGANETHQIARSGLLIDSKWTYDSFFQCDFAN